MHPSLLSSHATGSASPPSSVCTAHPRWASVVINVDEEAINNLGWTALIEAVILGDGASRHTQTVRALVEAGADPRIVDRNGMTSLQHAEARGYDSIASILRQVAGR